MPKKINPAFSSGVPWLNNSPTTLNRIIATASLTIPSPNTIENSFGYVFDLIIVKAATESEAQIVALYLIMRLKVSVTG